MVSDRSSRAENLTDLRKISMRVFFDSINVERKTQYGRQKHKHLVFRKKAYQNDWNGLFQETGKLLPAGPYYFIVEIIQTGELKKGWLYLNYK